MKAKTTMKSIRENYTCYRVGYCDLQYLFRGTQARFYNAGVYGWNCDIFTNERYNLAVTTGYRNMAGERVPSDMISRYEAKAKEIWNDWNSETLDKMDNLLTEFWKELSEVA